MGGLVDTDVSGGPDYSIDFLFGCQTSETGLFRTQVCVREREVGERERGGGEGVVCACVRRACFARRRV